jgi:Kinesin motor domain
VCCGHHTFSFDKVYGGGGLDPGALYRDCVEPLVAGVFAGYNATIFAYGQTGSGKTYTMGSQFTPSEPPRGVIPDALDSMFAKIDAARDTAFRLRVGFIEIHKARARVASRAFHAPPTHLTGLGSRQCCCDERVHLPVSIL